MKKQIGKAVVAGGLSLMLAAGGVTASAMSVPQTFGMGGGAPQRSQGQMVLREPGDYILRGSLTGGIRVDPGQGEVRLVLDGARLDGGTGPAVQAVSGDRLVIQQAPGSQNQIQGGFDLRSPGMEFENGMNGFQPTQHRNEQGGQQNGQLPAMPGNAQGNQQSGQLPAMPGNAQGNQQSGQLPAMPGNEQGSQQNGQLPAMPGNEQDNQQNGQLPAIPGNEQGGQQNGQLPAMPGNEQGGQQNGQLPAMPGDMGNQNTQPSTGTAGEIVEGITENSAMALEADADNAVTYTVTEENGTVKITDSGTYVVTGTASEGSITVKKGTTGVVLILEDLDLTSTSGAALSINKNAEVQVVISGDVVLSDDENPEDENSADAEIADAYDGAAIKIKAESVVFLTGDGTLTVNGNAKNGIKAGDDTSLVLGGDVTVNITAANDGINGNYDVTILSGDVTIAAGDDAIHADHILTIGQDGEGPDLTVTQSNEGLEGTVVNIDGGKVNVTAADDAINAANADGVYEGELGYSVNVTGGDLTLKAGSDGIDSNGNVNLVDGSATIRSANNGGDAGIDYDGDYYVSNEFTLNNQSGVAGPDGMPGGQMGGMPGQQSGPQSGTQPAQNGTSDWLDVSGNAPQGGPTGTNWMNNSNSIGGPRRGR